MQSASLTPEAIILVVLLNNLRDFEIARLLGWYRIPLRSAPKVIAVDFLAFYQSAAFGANKWRIQYIAPVQGYELVTRLELLQDEPEIPNANQEYFKVQIGPLVELPQPIPAGDWRRIVFLYTTGEYLLRAKTLNDLVVQSEERKLLWQSLRERADRYQSYQTERLPPIELDSTLLAALLGLPGAAGDADSEGQAR